MNELKNKVQTLLGREVSNLEKLHGDASYRTYYRATMDDGSTYIVMQMPEGKHSVSEEITNFNGTHEELAFINVHKFLARCELPVPAIVKDGSSDNILILEDLGNVLMWNLVNDKPVEVQKEWYTRAIDLLITMQERTDQQSDDSCVAFKRSFDETLLNWEFDHFLEYGIKARSGKTLNEEDRATFDGFTRTISTKIRHFPYGFTHRDFQSRNLLLKDDRLHMIDFQDALMGPQVYDLVSLLRDSYVALPSELVQELVKYYAEKRDLDEKKTLKKFDLVTVQRKLKDAGRFVFIDHVKNNPKFLPNIPASLGYVRQAFSRLDDCKDFYEILKKYVPEWQ